MEIAGVEIAERNWMNSRVTGKCQSRKRGRNSAWLWDFFRRPFSILGEHYSAAFFVGLRMT